MHLQGLPPSLLFILFSFFLVLLPQQLSKDTHFPHHTHTHTCTHAQVYSKRKDYGNVILSIHDMVNVWLLGRKSVVIGECVGSIATTREHTQANKHNNKHTNTQTNTHTQTNTQHSLPSLSLSLSLFLSRLLCSHARVGVAWQRRRRRRFFCTHR